VIEVGDEGAGFELMEDGNGHGSELEEGGLGIEIIRALADEVEIGSREEGGSRLRFVKFFAE
jgi:anti-sigma regulatory factor (Ser/Thr protein kinase)